MEAHMDRRSRLWMLLATVTIVAVLAMVWATLTFLLPFFPGHGLPPYYLPGDVEFFYTAKAVVSTVNIALLIFLLITYVDIYRKTQSEFTVGLIVFSMIFMLYLVVSNPLVIWAFGYRIFGLGPFALLPDIFTLAALVVLLYYVFKY
jgi:hypothetical protein